MTEDENEFVSPSGGVAPMTPSLMAKLFGVPLLIISVIVGCAIVVVLLFGSITTDRERSISGLLDVLESRVGERTAGVLLPNEKEVWQVGRELALRLQKKEAELTPEELETVVSRLSSLLARVSADSEGLSEMGRKQMHFVIQALSKTGSPAAVRSVVAVLDDDDATTRREALSALAGLRDVPEVRSALPRLIGALNDSDSVVRTVACVAVSAVADEGDAVAIGALGRVYSEMDREVRWNAALAMARLGSDRGKSTLLDMLSRRYWESEVKVRSETASGTVREYPLPPPAIERYLVVTVEASSRLADSELWAEIRRLESDASPAVVGAVRAAVERRASNASLDTAGV